MNREYDKLVFQIGFSHCGTHSIHYLFKNSGVKGCAHYLTEANKHIAIIMHNNLKNKRHPILGMDDLYVFTDMQYNSKEKQINFFKYYDLLAREYKNAKFILNTRPVENYINSRVKHESHLGLIKIRTSKWKELKRKEFMFHNKNVIKETPKDRLVVFDIENDNPKILVDFFPEYNLDPNNWKQHNKSK
jgi:hypothetical protein